MSAGGALTGLDRVPWGTLHHAWGPAGDVPRQIRALSAADAGTREAALDALSTSLWHQGRLFPATAAAIPFLLALIDDPSTPDRALLLLFLADAGRSAAFGDDPWYGEALAALSAGVPILERRLAATDEVERIAALVALAWADDGRVLRGRLQVGDEGERLVALYALVAGRAVPDPAVLAPFTEAAQPTARLAARLGGVRAGGPWGTGPIDVDAYGALAEVIATVAPGALPQPVELLDPAAATPDLVRSLASVLRRTRHHRVALPLVEFLLPAVLPDGFEEPPTEPQVEVLRAVADSPGAWAHPGSTVAALAEQGLDVSDRIDLCFRLGLDGPEGADRTDRDDTEALLAAGEACGVRYEDLTDHERALLERFVDRLDGLGWNDTRNWHSFVTSGSGFAISPIGVGRHFNERAVLECTLWLFDEHVAADTGERTGSPYARLVVADKAERRDPLGFRAYADDVHVLDRVLGVIDRHRPTLDRDGPADAFLHDLFAVTPKVEVELADGRVLEIRPRTGGQA